MRDHGHDGRQMTEKDWKATLRERFAAEGLAPSAHREAIDEIADHLNDL
jgi:hypothetical protein